MATNSKIPRWWRKARKRGWLIPAAAALVWLGPHLIAAPVSLAIAAAAGLLYYLAARRTMCGPAYGQESGSPLTDPGDRPLRIATFNIHGGKGRDGRRQIERIAGVLDGADLVGLQEVRGASLTRRQHQARQLGQALGAVDVFAPAVRQWWHYDFGNALLARLPIREWLRIPLPRVSAKTYHNVLLARCEYQGQPLYVLVAHVHLRCARERKLHLNAVLALFESLAEPVVLLADMNSYGDEPRLADAAARDDVQAISHRRDWIMVRGLRIENHGTIDRGASDHACVWADVRLAHSLQSARPAA